MIVLLFETRPICCFGVIGIPEREVEFVLMYDVVLVVKFLVLAVMHLIILRLCGLR